MENLHPLNVRLLRCSCAILALCATSAFAAKTPLLVQPLQITSQMYSAKFVCGGADRLSDLQSNVAPLSTPFEDFEPGRYATAVNIFNPTRTDRTITVVATAAATLQNVQVAQLTIPQFKTRRVGCLNIMPEIQKVFTGTTAGGQLIGQLIEGFVFFTQRDAALQVEVVYSYANDGDASGGASLDVVEVDPHTVDALIPVPAPLP